MPNPLIGVRLPLVLLARVDAFTEALRARTPGLRVSRQQAIEVLLTRALDAEGITGPSAQATTPKRAAPAAKKGAKRKARKP